MAVSVPPKVREKMPILRDIFPRALYGFPVQQDSEHGGYTSESIDFRCKTRPGNNLNSNAPKGYGQTRSYNEWIRCMVLPVVLRMLWWNFSEAKNQPFINCTITFLVEAMHLAKDFNAVCENEFPARAIAEHLTRANCSMEPTDMQRRKNMILATKTMLAELKELLSNDRSPICSSRPQPILEPAIQSRLTHFSMVYSYFCMWTLYW